MKRIFSYTISAAYNNCTLISFLKESGYSSQVITHLKRTENGILLNKTWARVRDILHTDDILTITLEEKTSSENIVASPLPLHIVYEDEDLMVINKPADMPIHPSQGNYDNTLANAVAYYYAQKEEPFTYRCINRLDRDTTGLLIIAKHALSASILSKQMKAREIRRTYLAVCKGQLPAEVGIINAPIARKADSAIERCVDFSNGESAVTHYRVRYYQNGYSLVELHLETGRTHQIRIHMQYLGNPLPGDYLYCPDYSKISRTALHSYRLAFCHPITGKRMDFYAPLPTDMAAFFQ